MRPDVDVVFEQVVRRRNSCMYWSVEATMGTAPDRAYKDMVLGNLVD
jgi:hypothetical protein